MTTIDVRKDDVLEIKTLDKWRFYKRMTKRADIKEAKGYLEDPGALCGWRIMRDGVEVGR